MSQAILNAIERAREKRARKWAQWWTARLKNPDERAKIEANRLRFDREFAEGIPLESIPLLSPEPPIEQAV